MTRDEHSIARSRKKYGAGNEMQKRSDGPPYKKKGGCAAPHP